MEEKRQQELKLKRKSVGSKEKKKGNRSMLILLLVTVGISLVFYLKNIDWGAVDLKIDFSWLKSIGGTRIVTFE